MKKIQLFSSLAVLTSAHFQLNYPPARGYVEDTLPQYPCGGQNNPSSNRTQVSLTSPFPIQLHMGHTQAKVQVLLAVGNNPTGADFTSVIVPTFQEDGPQNFCLGGVTIANNNSTITAGTNATIQVVTNGDDPGQSGLYNCADVTFTSVPLSPQDYSANCQNSTGVHAEPLAGQEDVNANGTAAGGASTTAATSASGATGSAGATAAAKQGAGVAVAPSWGWCGFAAVAAAAGGLVLGLGGD